jgi:hypothetical protein
MKNWVRIGGNVFEIRRIADLQVKFFNIVVKSACSICRTFKDFCNLKLLKGNCTYRICRYFYYLSPYDIPRAAQLVGAWYQFGDVATLLLYVSYKHNLVKSGLFLIIINI